LLLLSSSTLLLTIAVIFQTELEKSRHELEDLDGIVAQLKAVSIRVSLFYLPVLLCVLLYLE
jgi:hypothetical protein